MDCRVLRSGKCVITSPYGERSGGFHNGVDLVKEGYQLDYIVAHSDGKVIECRDGLGNMKGSNSYGNYVKIDHGNGYYTLYAHLAKGIKVKKGDTVKEYQTIGYMGDSGNSYGAHLHWEVWKNGARINPTPYLNADIIKNEPFAGVSDEELARRVWAGEFGNGDARKKALGSRYTAVQALVDKGIGKTKETVYKIVSNCSWLNLRTSASYGNNIYKAVKAGTKLEYLGTNNGWANVKYEGKSLYCGPKYLK